MLAPLRASPRCRCGPIVQLVWTAPQRASFGIGVCWEQSRQSTPRVQAFEVRIGRLG